MGLTFLFVGFARDFMVFMTEISFRISFYQPKCLSTNISMSAVIIILNKAIYIRTYFKTLEIINLGRGHPQSGHQGRILIRLQINQEERISRTGHFQGRRFGPRFWTSDNPKYRETDQKRSGFLDLE